MAILTVVSSVHIPVPNSTIYSVAVSGSVVTGEKYTINSTLGIIAQYSAIAGDTTSSIAAAMQALINSSYTSGVTITDPNTIIFHLPGSATVTSTPTTPPPRTPPVYNTSSATINYGLKYQCTFDPPSGGAVFFIPRYRLEILQKNYSGAATNVIGGETPVIHNYQTDDIKAPVRGSSLSISLINKGSLPLSSFFSVNADEFKVRFYWTERTLVSSHVDHLLFEGFLVQDDCNEPMVDFTHEINLSANDNLGLLKGVALDKAPGSYTLEARSPVEPFQSLAPHNISVSNAFALNLNVGDKIDVVGTSVDGTYLITNISAPGVTYTQLTIAEAIGTQTLTNADLGILTSNLLEKITLLSVIGRCLSTTGLQLKTNIYCNLLEINQVDTSSFLDQTLVDSQTFLKNDTDYQDCYTVLENILGRFNLSLFQANGVWNIVRWDELRYYNNQIPGYSYDKDFNLIGAVTLRPALNAGIGENTRAVYELFHRVFRPFDYDKETYNFEPPAHILRNNDLQILGGLITSYQTGSGDTLRKISEYKPAWWYPQGPAIAYIRVVKDQFDNEIQRYLVLKKDIIKSYRIEASKGDILELSFNVKADQQWSADTTVEYVVELTDGTQTKRIRNYLPIATQPATKEYWDNGGGWRFYTKTISTDNQVTITGPPVPFDGLIYISLIPLIPFAIHPAAETYYSDIRFNYTAFINESTKITGQTHTSTQLANSKNKEDKNLSVDSSPRNFIKGTLFLNQLNGIVQKRTATWRRGHMPAEKKNLGNITTFETLFWRRISRSILEGSFVGLLHDSKHAHVSALNVFKYTSMSIKNFVFGKLEIDYKHDKINNSPMWQVWQDGELDTDLTSDYQFRFLYDTK